MGLEFYHKIESTAQFTVSAGKRLHIPSPKGNSSDLMGRRTRASPQEVQAWKRRRQAGTRQELTLLEQNLHSLSLTRNVPQSYLHLDQAISHL